MKKPNSTLSSANIQGQLLRREIAELNNPARVLTLFQTLEALHDAIQGFESPQDIATIASEFLVGLDIFQSFAFFLDDSSADKALPAVCQPASSRDEYRRIFSELSSRDKFLFTVKQSRFVPIQVDYMNRRKWSIIQQISTERNFHGLFIGVMESEIDGSRQTDFSLLSFLLLEIAHLLEHAGLRQQMQEGISKLTKRVEERTVELSEAKVRAESSTRAKKEFLAVMNHELRTPLNGIFGFLSLFRDAQLDEVHADYLEKIQASAESLRGLIDDILDFSRIESGRLSVQGENVSLADLLEGVFQVHAWSAVVNHNELAFEIEPEVPGWAIIDSARLQQILSNLLGNAIKFTSNGTVTIRISRLPDSPQGEAGCILRFEVEDTGIGIDMDKVHSIFEPFTQGDSSDRRRYGGTGLGLSIVKRLVNLMGGTIDARNSARGGTVFSFTCPVQEGEPLDQEMVVRSAREKRVLLLEPSEAVARQLGKTLSALGVVSERVSTLESVIEQEDLSTFDFLFYDLAVHSQQGLAEFKEVLGDLGATCPPIVLIGTVDLFEEEFTTVAHRVVGHLLKPLRRREVGRLLNRLTNPNYTSGDEPGEEPKPGHDQNLGSRQPLEVLVIDENPVSRKVLMLSLSSLGYNPLGVDSIHLAEDQSRIRSFDLIFTDSKSLGKESAQHALVNICQGNAAASPRGKILLYLIGGQDDFPVAASPLKPFISGVLRRPVSRPKIREIVLAAAEPAAR